MDNAMIERLYNRGIRAYVSDRGNYFDEPPIDPDDPDDGGATPFAWAYKDGDEIWHALRAYQDAERKKGVPISFGNDLNPYEWFRRNYGGFNFTSGDGTRGMPPMIFSKAAKFTNFRWRAGYPKKGIGGIVPRIEDAQL